MIQVIGLTVIEKFMTKQGKTLKPAKQPIVPKDSKKVSAK